MPLVLADRVQQTGTANTTVSFTLTGSVSGFQSFAVIGNTNTTYYAATDASGNWEAGLGTYSTTGPTLTRTTVYSSSNSNLAVTFSGAVNVFVTYPSSRSVYEDASGNVSPLGTIASGVWQGTTIGVAYGGTGVTTSSGANSVMLRDANQNVAVNRLNQSDTATTAAGGTTTLTAASSYSQTLNGTGGQTYRMPDATTLTTGVAFVFNNNATGTLTLVDNASGALGTITAGGAAELVLLANGTVAGTWDVHGFLPESVTWGTNALALGSTVITGGTWNGGTITSAYGGTGLTTFTAANNALYSTSASALAAGTLPVAAGGTGITSLTLNRIPYGNGTSAFQSSANLTFDGTTLTASNISTSGSTTFSGGTANGVLYLNGSKVATSGSALTFDGTNLGVGASSPGFGVDVQNTGATTAAFSATRFSTGGGSAYLYLRNSRGATVGTNTIVQSGDPMGIVRFSGADGTNYIAGADIRGIVDGTPSTGNMPGRLSFYTTQTTTLTEVMRLDSSGNLGLGVTPSAWTRKAFQLGDASAAYVANNSGGATVLATNMYFDGSNRYATTAAAARYSVGTGNHEWYIAASGTAGTAITFTQAMTLDASGNLGIGTTSPSQKLDVNGSANISSRIYVTTGTAALPAYSFGGWVDTGIYNPTGTSLGFSTSGSEKMRLDSSGNLGLGVTPSAWNSNRKAIQSGNASFFSAPSAASYSAVGANMYNNTSGTDTYISSAAASLYLQNAGAHSWHTAASGTAGTAISFTQAMTLDASGNLGVGTTSPSGKLHIEGGTENAIIGSSSRKLYFRADGGGVMLGTGTSQTGNSIYFNEASNFLYFQTASTERMRIDSSGNVGIGTSSPGAKLDVSGDIIGRATTFRFKDSGNTTQYGAIYADSTTFNINAGVNNLLLYSAGTERFRIGSAGQLGIGGATYGTSGQVLTSGGSGAAPSWTTVSGGQYYGTAAVKAIAYNSDTIGENITIPSGQNGLTAGPVTVSTGFAVTVNGNWVVV